MDDKEMTKKIVGEVLAEIVEGARKGHVKRTNIGLMAYGSELGNDELLRGARLAMENDPSLNVIAIGPVLDDFSDISWIETPACEADVSKAMERALGEGSISGAVALHYPFPLGVATIGKVLTPARGRPCFIASSTGASSSGRVESLVLNAIYGNAVAKADGIKCPTVGILNLDGAQPAFRCLQRLEERGYPICFASSMRKEGGAILRGNDLIAGSADVCVTDTLTGNVLMKFFASWNTGGGYEALGWGYGPSVGEKWNKVVSIISRASGAPVIAGALCLAARCSAGSLPAIAEAELRSAREAGLDEIVASLSERDAPLEDNIQPPAAEPTDEELQGIDVLEIENAVRVLWKAGIYAESSMGCTGPVIKTASIRAEKARSVLRENGYI